MGAIATGGTRILHKQIIQDLGISPNTIDAVTLNEKKELDRREKLYPRERPPPAIERRVVIVVGDGPPTRSTMKAALEGLRQQQTGRLNAGVPTPAQHALR